MEKRYVFANQRDGKYESIIWPEPVESNNDIYLITQSGDRLDHFASKYFQDEAVWYIIALANANVVTKGSLVLEPGIQIRIPKNLIDFYDQVKSENTK